MKLKNRTKIILFVLILVIIFLAFFLKNNYKNLKAGNNMSNKSIEEFEQYILNISSYEAKIEMVVNSNKNTNKYIILQTYEEPNKTKQTVLEPSNIEGLETEYDGQNLIIRNTKLNSTTVYENYEYLVNNYITLEAFITSYNTLKEASKAYIYEENNNVIMEIEEQANNYIYKKTLYISKETGTPLKLLIQGINGEDTVYILYNEIKIN